MDRTEGSGESRGSQAGGLGPLERVNQGMLEQKTLHAENVNLLKSDLLSSERLVSKLGQGGYLC